MRRYLEAGTLGEGYPEFLIATDNLMLCEPALDRTKINPMLLEAWNFVYDTAKLKASFCRACMRCACVVIVVEGTRACRRTVAHCCFGRGLCAHPHWLRRVRYRWLAEAPINGTEGLGVCLRPHAPHVPSERVVHTHEAVYLRHPHARTHTRTYARINVERIRC